MEDYIGLVNKPPIDEIYNLDLVNKPDICDESLAHFGILGMKWGIRRYQNPDGTLTEAGKNRLRKREEQKARQAQKRKERILNDPAKLMKHQKEFTNEELKRAKDRLWALNDISKANNEKIFEAKKKVDNLLAFGETINNGIRFLNSPAGKGIRQSLGLSTEDWLKFKPSKTSAEEARDALKLQAELYKYKAQIARDKYTIEHPENFTKKKKG